MSKNLNVIVTPNNTTGSPADGCPIVNTRCSNFVSIDKVVLGSHYILFPDGSIYSYMLEFPMRVIVIEMCYGKYLKVSKVLSDVYFRPADTYHIDLVEGFGIKWGLKYPME